MTRKSAMPLVVLISGRGSNLRAIIAAIESGALDAEIKAVISNIPTAQGLSSAQRAGIATVALDHTNDTDRERFDRELMHRIEVYRPGLVVLAGYMRILSAEFVDHFKDRLLNIHPSLLPDFRGLHTHRRALEAGVSVHGASVHMVSHELDSGAIIAQAQVPVLRNDDEDTLAARVLAREQQLYPLVLRWFAEQRLTSNNGALTLDGAALTEPFIFKPDEAID